MPEINNTTFTHIQYRAELWREIIDSLETIKLALPKEYKDLVSVIYTNYLMICDSVRDEKGEF